MRHICFNPSGATTLRSLLRKQGRMNDVLTLPDDLSLGPISSVTGEERRRWLEEFYNTADFDPLWNEQLVFWRQVRQPSEAGDIIWLNRNAVHELCCFHEFVSVVPDHSAFMIGDFTKRFITEFSDSDKAHALSSCGLLNEQQWQTGFGLARKANTSEFAEERRNWSRLKQENAPLRAITNDQLSSVPIEHFDDDILALIPSSWRRAAPVIGECLMMLPGQERYAQFSDLFLIYRLEAMADNGRIELRGEGDIQKMEVRSKPIELAE